MPTDRYVTLACPKCGMTVVVLEGCQAWCPCQLPRIEMEESAA